MDFQRGSSPVPAAESRSVAGFARPKRPKRPPTRRTGWIPDFRVRYQGGTDRGLDFETEYQGGTGRGLDFQVKYQGGTGRILDFRRRYDLYRGHFLGDRSERAFG